MYDTRSVFSMKRINFISTQAFARLPSLASSGVRENVYLQFPSHLRKPQATQAFARLPSLASSGVRENVHLHFPSHLRKPE